LHLWQWRPLAVADRTLTKFGLEPLRTIVTSHRWCLLIHTKWSTDVGTIPSSFVHHHHHHHHRPYPPDSTHTASPTIICTRYVPVYFIKHGVFRVGHLSGVKLTLTPPTPVATITKLFAASISSGSGSSGSSGSSFISC